MNKNGERIEKIYTVAALLFFTGAFFRSLYGMFDPTSGASTGNLPANVIWVGIYLSSAWLLKSRCGGFRRSLSNLRPLIWLLIIIFASTAWSDAPFLTFLRFGALAGSASFGLYFGTRYSLRMQLELLGWTFGLAAGLSIVFSLLLPSYSIGTDPFQGMWLGIYQHKNILGINMSMAFVVFLALSHCYPAKRWHFRFMAGTAVAIIILANSATSLIECVVMCWVYPFWARLQPSDKSKRLSGIILAITGVMLALSPLFLYVQIVTALGRDVELTGRLGLWYLVTQFISQRPFLGYGYFAFWRGVDGPLGQFWSLGTASSHDGLLDVWLELGLLGLIAFLTAYLSCAKRAFHALRQSGRREDIWPILAFSWMFISNLAESTYLRPNRLQWTLFVAVIATLCVREATPVREEYSCSSSLKTNTVAS